MFETDAVVIGAGVIGLAVARALSMRGLDVVILESEGAIGTQTSSHNSEVIHAGIYYPEGSLKARLCVEGRRRLYDYCESHKVPFRRCGKLIVAVEQTELSRLAQLLEAGRRNGVEGLAEMSSAEVARLEPDVRSCAALHSPVTGIVDSHAYMLALLGEAEDHGARIAFYTPFERAVCEGDGFTVRAGGAEPMNLRTRVLVNAAGLFVTDVARNIEGLPDEHVRQTYWAKGNYFALSRRAPFRQLIYPLPEPGGLGVHLTLDMGGQARFGPDVAWKQSVDYDVDTTRHDAFSAAIRRYWPGLDPSDLHPAYAGVRPKLSAEGEPAADFAIDGPAVHGVPGLVNLFGIESPGLTASLAIANDAVRDVVA